MPFSRKHSHVERIPASPKSPKWLFARPTASTPSAFKKATQWREERRAGPLLMISPAVESYSTFSRLTMRKSAPSNTGFTDRTRSAAFSGVIPPSRHRKDTSLPNRIFISHFPVPVFHAQYTTFPGKPQEKSTIFAPGGGTVPKEGLKTSIIRNTRYSVSPFYPPETEMHTDQQNNRRSCWQYSLLQADPVLFFHKENLFYNALCSRSQCDV